MLLTIAALGLLVGAATSSLNFDYACNNDTAQHCVQ